MVAQSFTHTALDAIAFMSFADNLACGEADTRAKDVRIGLRRLRGEEPAHRCGLAFATGRVGSLIIGMFGKTHTCQRLTLTWLRHIQPWSVRLPGLVRLFDHGNAGGVLGRRCTEGSVKHSGCTRVNRGSRR